MSFLLLVYKLLRFKEHIQSTLSFQSLNVTATKYFSIFRKVRLFDCTSENNFKEWNVDGEVEKVLWNHFNPFTFLVSNKYEISRYS